MSKSQSVITASFDGACQPFNPGGHIGLGWVVGEHEYHEYVTAREGNSNNVAEYMALIRLLETIAASPNSGELRITGDSQLVVCQILGEWSVGAKHIIPLHAKAVGLIERLTAAGWHTFRHSLGTNLRFLGIDIKTAQELLRHANSRITLDLYTQAVSTQKREANAKLVDMLLPSPKPQHHRAPSEPQKEEVPSVGC